MWSRLSIFSQRNEIADICSPLSGHQDYFNSMSSVKKNSRLIHIGPLTFNGQYKHLMSLCTACQRTTLKAFFRSPVNCERWRRWRGDKLWETAVRRESSMRGKGQRNANSGFCLWVSDCSARPFSKSLPRPPWMDANYPAQQCSSTIL